jgi:hypothetical protein
MGFKLITLMVIGTDCINPTTNISVGPSPEVKYLSLSNHCYLTITSILQYKYKGTNNRVIEDEVILYLDAN